MESALNLVAPIWLTQIICLSPIKWTSIAYIITSAKRASAVVWPAIYFRTTAVTLLPSLVQRELGLIPGDEISTEPDDLVLSDKDSLFNNLVLSDGGSLTEPGPVDEGTPNPTTEGPDLGERPDPVKVPTR